jgi:hypothetical protein
VVPLLDSYKFFTIKELQYNYFKSALQIRPQTSTEIGLIKECMKAIKFNYSYVPSTYYEMPSKSWLVGFVEAEGSFSLTKNSSVRGTYRHRFVLSQKKDSFLLEKIRQSLGIDTVVFTRIDNKTCKYVESKVEAHNLKDLLFVAEYFKNCFVGVKATEFEMWRHSLLYYRNDHDALKSTQEAMRHMRNEHKFKK